MEELASRTPAEASRERQRPEREPPDLHTLLGQMIAVRQEVNLQTKAVRAQQELNTESLQLLEETLEELRKSKAAGQQQQQSPDDLLRPLLKTLIDVQDALSLALREASRVQETLEPLLDGLSAAPEPEAVNLGQVGVPPLESPPRPWLARLLGVQGVDSERLAAWQEQARSAYAKNATEGVEVFGRRVRERGEQSKQGCERVKQMLGSLIAGYRMGLQRVERALQQNGLEAIPAVGQPFDPERMEVLEAVAGSGRPAGEVLEELRRGYLWRGRVFRYAQVRVARS